jgi:hypothetical protein
MKRLVLLPLLLASPAIAQMPTPVPATAPGPSRSAPLGPAGSALGPAGCALRSAGRLRPMGAPPARTALLQQLWPSPQRGVLPGASAS